LKDRLPGLGRLTMLALVFLLVSSAPAWAVQATLVADAHVSGAQPSVNSGNLSNLNVGGGYTSLLQFDLGVLPAGTTAAQIARATLRLYVNRMDAAGSVSVGMVAGAWGEGAVTYATLPTMGATVGTIDVQAVDGFVTVDVTQAVQAWVGGVVANNGFVLTAGSAVVQFDSKENDQTAHVAQLEIALAAGGAGSVGATGATGAIGPAGPQGVAGPMGLIGPQGLTGAPGAVGPAGPVGSAGPIGATGPVGATGPIGAIGASGPMGPAGPEGVTGSQGQPGAIGPQGSAGVPGADGAVGASGAAGSPGLVYQGAYSSTTNYALGDVVLWQGASWASLAASNHGQTPSASPDAWGMLTAQGPTGATGAPGQQGMTGAAGPVGGVGPPGEKGDQGAQGIAGQAGAQGIPGTTGTTGLQGPMGPAGPAGPVGMNFLGAYASTTNYALGDGVLWQGAGWVSLADSNHGNTPDQSPLMWAMFAAPGAAGPVGPAGSTGATGTNGRDGMDGLQGPAGATGATGAPGAPGLRFQGAYVSTDNYALGDVVVWQGSSWASLVDSNHGNAPDAFPTFWGMLTAAGSVGPQGVPGPSGLPGPAGATGAQGSTGPAGPMGPQGSVGSQGPAGAQGLNGTAGSAGAQGVAGPQGEAGQAGAQGIPGVAGPQGATGVTGAIGPAGAVGLTMRGAYEAASNYAAGEGVLWQGAGWVSLLDGNHSNAPDQSPLAWAMFSASGATGATGAQGAAGPMGSAGPQGPAGATGAQGSVGPQGATGAQGPAGAAGPTGATGPVGITFRDAWTHDTNYAVNDAVTWNGSTWLALTAGSGHQPDASPQDWTLLAQAGGAGPTGATGQAATINIGTVTTLAAGSAATVTNVGTANAAVLNLGVPQGAQGASGSSGAAGVVSGNFAAVYHAVDFTTLFYSVNLPTASGSETASVLAWVPQGCTVTRMDVKSLQTGNITVTLRSGASQSTMVDTSIACQPQTAGSCPALGSVNVPAGSFLDLRIDSASSLTAGVWTALTCQW
jgi:collagen type VII alpha